MDYLALISSAPPPLPLSPLYDHQHRKKLNQVYDGGTSYHHLLWVPRNANVCVSQWPGQMKIYRQIAKKYFSFYLF